MNTGFSGPQVREVVAREGVDLFVYDEEFEPLIAELELRHGRFRAWLDSRHEDGDTLDALIAARRPRVAPPKPAHAPRLVILTSGTTGTPKGAGRDVPISLSPVGGPLSKVPFRSGDVAQISAPLFHALGFTQGLLQIGLGATLVLQRRFVPAGALDSLASNRVTTWVIVPVMLQRVLALEPGAAGPDRDLSRAADHLPERLAARARTWRARRSSASVRFSTTSTARPRSPTRRSRPRPTSRPSRPASDGSCAARWSRSSTPTARSCPPVETGPHLRRAHDRSSRATPAAATRSGSAAWSPPVTSATSTPQGRLFIDGRDDEMIISGGENVFPREVEELLHLHPGVLEAAAVGVPDEQFGQRLSVFVVLREGAGLTEEDVKQYVRDNLARYKVPRRSSSSTSSRATRLARCSSASCSTAEAA